MHLDTIVDAEKQYMTRGQLGLSSTWMKIAIGSGLMQPGYHHPATHFHFLQLVALNHTQSHSLPVLSLASANRPQRVPTRDKHTTNRTSKLLRPPRQSSAVPRLNLTHQFVSMRLCCHVNLALSPEPLPPLRILVLPDFA